MHLEIIEIVGLILIAIEGFVLYRLYLKKGSLKPSVKRLSLLSIIVIPILIMFTANYHVFETSKTVSACMNCHIMKPMGNDMLDASSQTLAARHMKNHWIKENQCYGCHKDYGLNGTLKAKTDGYRHLMRYITGTYTEPIVYRGEFNSDNCLSCHQGTPAFDKLKVHQPVVLNLQGDAPTMSCMNCHGRAHPTRVQRTPGHPDYEKLIGERPQWEAVDDVTLVKNWISKLN